LIIFNEAFSLGQVVPVADLRLVYGPFREAMQADHQRGWGSRVVALGHVQQVRAFPAPGNQRSIRAVHERQEQPRQPKRESHHRGLFIT